MHQTAYLRLLSRLAARDRGVRVAKGAEGARREQDGSRRQGDPGRGGRRVRPEARDVLPGDVSQGL